MHLRRSRSRRSRRFAPATANTASAEQTLRICGCPLPSSDLPTVVTETKEADMTRYILTVPYEFQRNGRTETRFRRVGAVFENARRETGEVFLSVKLDFPVAVTELVAFPPRPEDDADTDDAKP